MIDTLLRKYPLISDQVDVRELRVILRELERVLVADVPGDIVEFGCYAGTASLFIARLLQAQPSKRAFHVYDSFEGLPEKTHEDASPAGLQFKPGELRATKAGFVTQFKKAGLPVPVVHKGWFDRLRPHDIPAHIAFAFLDGDYYRSIRDSLRLISPGLSPGAVIIIDDYQNEALPGAARASDEWLRGHPGVTVRTEASLAILRLPG
jgi:O-methyltransferase